MGTIIYGNYNYFRSQIGGILENQPPKAGSVNLATQLATGATDWATSLPRNIRFFAAKQQP